MPTFEPPRARCCVLLAAIVLATAYGCGARTEPVELPGAPARDAGADADTAPVDAGVDTGPVDAGSDTRPTDAGGCGDASVDWLRERFMDCGDEGRVGQSESAPGATCSAVCCALGYRGCSHRAAQSGFGACNIEDPIRSGECSDVFAELWSSQCICEGR